MDVASCSRTATPRCAVYLRIARVVTHPELLKISELRSLHFAVEMRRPRRDRPELNRVASEPALHGLGEELPAPVGLDALDRERHLINDAFQELDRVPACTSSEDTQDPKP